MMMHEWSPQKMAIKKFILGIIVILIAVYKETWSKWTLIILGGFMILVAIKIWAMPCECCGEDKPAVKKRRR